MLFFPLAALLIFAVLYVGSRCKEGFYADQIINVLNMRDYTVGLFLYWCAMTWRGI